MKSILPSRIPTSPTQQPRRFLLLLPPIIPITPLFSRTSQIRPPPAKDLPASRLKDSVIFEQVPVAQDNDCDSLFLSPRHENPPKRVSSLPKKLTRFFRSTGFRFVLQRAPCHRQPDPDVRKIQSLMLVTRVLSRARSGPAAALVAGVGTYRQNDNDFPAE